MKSPALDTFPAIRTSSGSISSFRLSLIFVAGLCLWSQLHSYSRLGALKADNPDPNNQRELRLTDADREWMALEPSNEESVENVRLKAEAEIARAETKRLKVETERLQLELENARLKAEARVSKAEAEQLRLETERLKLALNKKVKLDAQRAQQGATAADILHSGKDSVSWREQLQQQYAAQATPKQTNPTKKERTAADHKDTVVLREQLKQQYAPQSTPKQTNPGNHERKAVEEKVPDKKPEKASEQTIDKKETTKKRKPELTATGIKGPASEAKPKKKLPIVPEGPKIEDTTIRQWGCARNESPFIFVHIGKAGGGGVRARMAASALRYNRTGWWEVDKDTSYYYPVQDPNGELHKGKFSSSRSPNFVPKKLVEMEKDFTFEGLAPCSATTPLGQALACPIPSAACDDVDGDGLTNRCDLVYVGHNLIGNELHWLPNDYLVDWWKSTRWGSKEDDFIHDMIANRHVGGKEPWRKTHERARSLMNGQLPEVKCPPGALNFRYFRSTYKECSEPKEDWMDQVTKHVTGEDPNQYGAEVIASLPVLRVTVMRDPFSWLTSKFFWHENHLMRDGSAVTPYLGPFRNNRLIQKRKAGKLPVPNFVKCDDIDIATSGWATNRAMTYIFYLCGEHCMGGYAKGTMTLEDMERQAAFNLRNSFAVVGQLEKTDEFYEMVTKRVAYMDTSLNPHVKGKPHGSGSHEEALRCKKVYKDPEFQSKMMAKSPALAALFRLYLVSLEVNEFQVKELAECAA